MTESICPTECDDDCDAPCHEAHKPTWKRDHDPATCRGDEPPSIHSHAFWCKSQCPDAQPSDCDCADRGIEPLSDSFEVPLTPTTDEEFAALPILDLDKLAAAPHFYTRRPIHLCTDGRDNGRDDDDGPPNWADQ